MSDLSEATWDRVERAKELGCEVIEPDAFTLLLDYDSIEAWLKFAKQRNLIEELFGIKKIEEWNSSSSPPNKHVRVTLDTALSADQRLALQAALGSDPTREILGVRRTQLSIEHPSLLFKPENSEIRVIYDPERDDIF